MVGRHKKDPSLRSGGLRRARTPARCNHLANSYPAKKKLKFEPGGVFSVGSMNRIVLDARRPLFCGRCLLRHSLGLVAPISFRKISDRIFFFEGRARRWGRST